jgi:hypothetical protein
MEDSTAINLERDKRFDEKLKSSQLAVEDRARASSESHTAFFDKLAVLSAGSIGVAISLIGAALSSKLVVSYFAPSSKWLIIGSLFLLFIALSLCILHNYLELKVQRHSVPLAKRVKEQVLMGRGFEYGNYGGLEVFARINEDVMKLEGNMTSLRLAAYRVGLAASLSFLFGYLCVLVWIAIIIHKA